MKNYSYQAKIVDGCLFLYSIFLPFDRNYTAISTQVLHGSLKSIAIVFLLPWWIFPDYLGIFFILHVLDNFLNEKFEMSKIFGSKHQMVGPVPIVLLQDANSGSTSGSWSRVICIHLFNVVSNLYQFPVTENW